MEFNIPDDFIVWSFEAEGSRIGDEYSSVELNGNSSLNFALFQQ